jgi:hypothetical protein
VWLVCVPWEREPLAIYDTKQAAIKEANFINYGIPSAPARVEQWTLNEPWARTLRERAGFKGPRFGGRTVGLCDPPSTREKV